MKNLLIGCVFKLIVINCTVSTYAQIIEIITYEETQNEDYCAGFGSPKEIKAYKSKDGSILKIGSPLIIGKPSTSYGKFSYIESGMMSMGDINMGENILIEKIQAFRPKVKNPTLLITVKAIIPQRNYSKNRNIWDYEKAIMLGEIINPNATMTRAEAIKKLKESKDLLDLGMISKEKYDSMKAVLAPLITGNN